MNTKKMPTLRQRVTTYFRQLSFIAEPREEEPSVNSDDGSFITKYLEGRLDPAPPGGPTILHGKDLIDLPEMLLMRYDTGSDKITAATTGPDEGLVGIKRSRLHLSAGIADIDFIDTPEVEPPPVSKSKSRIACRPDSNANEKKIPPSSRRSSVTQKPNAANKPQESLKLKTDNNSNKQPQPQDTLKFSTKFSTSTNSIHNLDSLNKNFNELDKKLSQYSINKAIEDDGVRSGQTVEEVPLIKESIAGVTNWANDTDDAYGLSVSLYEKSQISGEHAGSPIADCFGMVARGNSCAMALADGVNWGEGARIAARSAIQGSLEYIDTAVFGQGSGGTATTTREVFVSLLRSFWEAHACILETGGSLTTLTVAIILPLSDDKYFGQYVCCCCNVGDSLGYIYSKVHGVRELTEFSHNINDMRDMRDALGALGPVDGNKPELGNLTLSMTVVDPGDIVFLTSDGISDNFDPVVGKFAEAFFSSSQIAPSPPGIIQNKLAPKKQNKSTSSINTKSSVTMPENIQKPSTKVRPTSSFADLPPVRPPRTKKTGTAGSEPVKGAEKENIPSRPKYSRSHTVIEPRMKLKKSSAQPIARAIHFPKSINGLPLVTGPQRHALTLLRLADLFNFGINGSLRPCATSKKLCQLLIDFVTMITTAKRKMLEQRELFYKTSFDPDGNKREADEAIINRYGFNSDGHEMVFQRLRKITQNSKRAKGLLGINLGKNKTSKNTIDDYVKGIVKFGPIADYLVINISSPNTPDLRSMQHKEHLYELLSSVVRARNELKPNNKIPILLKLAPDLTVEERKDIVTILNKKDCHIDGLIISNTTVARDGLISQEKNEIGGLSGRPLTSRSTQMIAEMYTLTKGQVPIIGVGGIFTGEDAMEKILAGASIVQLYTSFIYYGPPIVGRIKSELNELLITNGYKNVQEAVGKEANKYK